MRNIEMARRIEAAPARYPFRFAIAGDSGAWADATAEAIFAQLVRQIADLRPAFFVNLGDFAGPGSFDRHEAYLRVVGRLPVPDVCIAGNHDLDDPAGEQTWTRVHGPMNFSFAHGHTRFVAIHAAGGPRPDDLEFLESALRASAEPHRVVLMHMPPYLEGHYAPHKSWGFKRHEREFLDILRAHRVKLVCCAHGLAFDRYVHDDILFVMTGGGGTGLCSHFRGVCTGGDGAPEDRGSLFHFVELSVAIDGALSGRVVQAFTDPLAFAQRVSVWRGEL